jgi:hypothetical protein
VFFILNWVSFKKEKSKLKPISAGIIKPLLIKVLQEEQGSHRARMGYFDTGVPQKGDLGFRLKLFLEE